MPLGLHFPLRRTAGMGQSLRAALENGSQVQLVHHRV